MWIQQKINKRLIKKAIGSEYVYQIENEEKIKWWYDFEKEKSNKLKSFLKEWVNEMKREMNKKYE